ncbi:hypothetical protein [Bartonella sp. CM100XJJH]
MTGRGENCGFEIRGILLMELGGRWLGDVMGIKLRWGQLCWRLGLCWLPY